MYSTNELSKGAAYLAPIKGGEGGGGKKEERGKGGRGRGGGGGGGGGEKGRRVKVEDAIEVFKKKRGGLEEEAPMHLAVLDDDGDQLAGLARLLSPSPPLFLFPFS